MLSTSMPSSASSGASSRSVSLASPGLNWISGRPGGGSGLRRRMSATARPSQRPGSRRAGNPPGCLAAAVLPGGVAGAQARGRGVPAQGLARAGVEFGGDRGQPFGVVDAQVAALREVLAQQPVGVLVARPLPRAGFLAEEHRHAQRLGDLGVQRHLAALVPGQRPAQLRPAGAERGDDGVADRVGGVPPAGRCSRIVNRRTVRPGCRSPTGCPRR